MGSVAALGSSWDQSASGRPPVQATSMEPDLVTPPIFGAGTGVVGALLLDMFWRAAAMAAAMASPAMVAGSGVVVAMLKVLEVALMLDDQSVGGTSTRE